MLLQRADSVTVLAVAGDQVERLSDVVSIAALALRQRRR